MADVFEVLKTDHLEVNSMLDSISEGPADGAGGVAERLVIEESRHEAVEEMYFWPAVREHVAGGDQIADTALEQESEGKELLEAVRKADPSSAEFASAAAQFVTAAREHIAYEEQQAWPKLQAVLSPEQRQELGDKVTAAKKTAPTRPHPHGPDSAAGVKTVGAAAAMADKVRDAASGRGD